jgi:RsiW-degrading membrane proteinase PrsW (M82 family)
MVPVWLSALVVALPTYFYARLVRGVDRFEREPDRYLVAAFIWGALPAALLALIVQVVFGLPIAVLLGEEASQSIGAIVLAPISEELFKGLAVAALFFWRRREFDGWVDGIVYGSTVGFGFAYIENVIYLSSAQDLEEWIRLFFLRVIVFGFLHGFYTSLIGIGFGLARYASTLLGAIAVMLGLAAAIMTHAIHNASVVLGEATEGSSLLITLANYGLLAVLMLGLRIVSRYNDRRMFKMYLANEVPEVISMQTYAALIGQPTQPPVKLSVQLKHLAGELVQRKHQLLKHNEQDHGEIERLRAQLRALHSSAERATS